MLAKCQTFTMSVVTIGLVLSIACRTNESPERQVKDVSITATVKARLASDLNPTTLTNLSVNVTNGVVTLAGQVPTEADKRRAEEIARSVDGVVGVNNNLQIQPAT
jgi:hyperosmotically inducible protein